MNEQPSELPAELVLEAREGTLPLGDGGTMREEQAGSPHRLRL
jgi:hypothetical protein